MDKLIDAIKLSYATENWHGALYMTLALPDICAGMEHPKKGNGERYRDWFNAYLKSAFITTNSVFLTAEDCWALRNSVLHEGTDEVPNSKGPLQRIKFTAPGPHLGLIDGQVAIFKVSDFCESFIAGVAAWLADMQGRQDVMARIGAMVRVEAGAEFSIAGVTFVDMCGPDWPAGQLSRG